MIQTWRAEWLVWKCPAGSAAHNMAADEVLLENVAILGRPVLRLYSWSERAASFGYFQSYAEVGRMTVLRPLVRRPTGGGLVPHDADWTYSLVFPPADPWHRLKAVESYYRAHAWVQSAFNELQIKTDLAPVSRNEAAGQCFVGAKQHDVLWRDKKIAGGAQRRNRQGLLIQGSIQPPAGIERGPWEQAFCNVAERNWSIAWKDYTPSAEILDQIGARAAQKFSRDEYNCKR